MYANPCDLLSWPPKERVLTEDCGVHFLPSSVRACHEHPAASTRPFQHVGSSRGVPQNGRGGHPEQAQAQIKERHATARPSGEIWDLPAEVPTWSLPDHATPSN